MLAGSLYAHRQRGSVGPGTQQRSAHYGISESVFSTSTGSPHLSHIKVYIPPQSGKVDLARQCGQMTESSPSKKLLLLPPCRTARIEGLGYSSLGSSSGDVETASPLPSS
jgi:hypothetical protein